MLAFIYDKSFDGLLSAIFDAYTRKSFPDRIFGNEDIIPLTITARHHVETTPEKTTRVYAGLNRKLSSRALYELLQVWLSEDDGSDELLFRYICKIFDSKTSIEKNMSDPDVWGVVSTARKVSRETGHMLGFTRFQKTAQSIYFSVIRPKYNILPLILGHFADRLADQHWIIYDIGRHYGIMCKDGMIDEVFVDEIQIKNGALRGDLLDENEILLQELWRGYHEAISIKDRHNPGLQRRLMPKRYWKFMTEMQGKPEAM